MYIHGNGGNNLDTSDKNTPTIQCAILLIQKNGVTKSPNSVIDQLSDCNVKPISEIKPKVGDCYVYAIAETKMRGWYLDDILHVMFSKARPYFEDIKKIIDANDLQVEIDISFIHKKAYPALCICQECINDISFLNAGVSIDAY